MLWMESGLDGGGEGEAEGEAGKAVDSWERRAMCDGRRAQARAPASMCSLMVREGRRGVMRVATISSGPKDAMRCSLQSSSCSAVDDGSGGGGDESVATVGL